MLTNPFWFSGNFANLSTESPTSWATLPSWANQDGWSAYLEEPTLSGVSGCLGPLSLPRGVIHPMAPGINASIILPHHLPKTCPIPSAANLYTEIETIVFWESSWIPSSMDGQQFFPFFCLLILSTQKSPRTVQLPRKALAVSWRDFLVPHWAFWYPFLCYCYTECTWAANCLPSCYTQLARYVVLAYTLHFITCINHQLLKSRSVS